MRRREYNYHLQKKFSRHFVSNDSYSYQNFIHLLVVINTSYIYFNTQSPHNNTHINYIFSTIDLWPIIWYIYFFWFFVSLFIRIIFFYVTDMYILFVLMDLYLRLGEMGFLLLYIRLGRFKIWMICVVVRILLSQWIVCDYLYILLICYCTL